MMDAIKELSEDEFMNLALIIYCYGYPEHVTDSFVKSERGDAMKRKLKRRIKEWLEL